MNFDDKVIAGLDAFRLLARQQVDENLRELLFFTIGAAKSALLISEEEE